MTFSTFKYKGTHDVWVVLNHTDPSKEDIEAFFHELGSLYNNDTQPKPFRLHYDVRDCDIILSGLGSCAVFSKTLREFEKLYESEIRDNTESIKIIVNNSFVQRIANSLVGAQLVPITFEITA